MLAPVLAAAVFTAAAAPPLSPEARALSYLVREVPRWSKENHCYSCHHNGDAMRALYIAARLGYAIPSAALAETTRWLERPEKWDDNGGKGPFSDKKLARLQFAAALAEAKVSGRSKDRRALESAARLIVGEQARDGSWKVDTGGNPGSPATHGPALATTLAVKTLRQTGGTRYREAIAKADRWLRTTPLDGVLDAAAVLLALGKASDADAVAQRRRCLEHIRKGEARKGGWGPYVVSAPEVFDTAVVLIALAGQEQTAEVKGWIKRGRAFLLGEQEKGGNWVETTRPSGGESYAQRTSTTAWATMALMATRK
jgi:hypothetical protein